MIVVWRITDHCNLGCPFCGYDRNLPWKRAEADPAAVLAFGRVLGEFQRETGKTVMVSWLGGEPLLWGPLEEVGARLVREDGLRLSVTTNGRALTAPKWRRHLRETYAEVTVSVDGLAEFHERARQWPGGFALLREAVRGLAAERQGAGEGPLLRVNVVLMRSNLKGFPALCEELAGWGIDEITLNQLGGIERPEFFEEERLREPEVEWLLEQVPRLRTLLAGGGVRLRGSAHYFARLRASACGQTLPVDDCGPGVEFLFVTTAGVVSPCNFTTDLYGVPLTELQTAAALRALPGRFAKMRRDARSPFCEDCPSTHVFKKFLS